MSVPMRRPSSGNRGAEPPGGDLPAEERRAPTEAEWAAMSPEQRLQVEEELKKSLLHQAFTGQL